MSYKTKKHCYIITSERYFSDEIGNEFYSDSEYKVNDIIILDGIKWFIDKVIR